MKVKDNLFSFLFLILVALFYYVPNTTASPIIDGLPDIRHFFKFHVSVHKKNASTNVYGYSCGGSIISEKHILTVAHCFMTTGNNGVIQDIFYPFGAAKIIAGTNHMNGRGIERDIIRVFIPSEPNRRLFYVDLAVAKLSANLGVHRYPDSLAIIPLEVLNPHSNAGVNQRATLCGFGYDVLERSVPRSSGNTINKFMNGRILGRDECPMFEEIICVRNADTSVFRSPCLGDSGSGLIYNEKLIGVLSNGPPNCDDLRPIQFTRLFGNMRFIIAAQNPHGDHGSMHVLHKMP